MASNFQSSLESSISPRIYESSPQDGEAETTLKFLSFVGPKVKKKCSLIIKKISFFAILHLGDHFEGVNPSEPILGLSIAASFFKFYYCYFLTRIPTSIEIRVRLFQRGSSSSLLPTSFSTKVLFNS